MNMLAVQCITPCLSTLAVDEEYMQAPPLTTVLAGHISSSSPYNLSAFEDFLAANYCSEVLEFITAVFNYRNKYELKIFLDSPTHHNMHSMCEQWQNLLEMYIMPNAKQEINLPSAARNELLKHSHPAKPPSPDLLQVAYNLMLELLGGVYVQFSESLRHETNILDSTFRFVISFRIISHEV
jgi:lysyl-tRNA synthetase class I